MKRRTSRRLRRLRKKARKSATTQALADLEEARKVEEAVGNSVAALLTQWQCTKKGCPHHARGRASASSLMASTMRFGLTTSASGPRPFDRAMRRSPSLLPH